MRRGSRLANLPERITAGAFILNSGLTKLQTDKESAGALHGMASSTYPVLEDVRPETFAKGLGMAEVGLGGALLFPLLGDGPVGAALTGYSGALLGLYLKTPGMREEGGFRPSQQGAAFAKDIWLLGIGLSLVAHSAGARRQARKLSRANKANKMSGRPRGGPSVSATAARRAAKGALSARKAA